MSMITIIKQVKDLGLSEYARLIKHSYPIKFDQLHFLLKYFDFEKLFITTKAYLNHFTRYQNLSHPLNLNPTREEIKQHCLHLLQISGAKSFRVSITQVNNPFDSIAI
jgi:hypothetical protein